MSLCHNQKKNLSISFIGGLFYHLMPLARRLSEYCFAIFSKSSAESSSRRLNGSNSIGTSFQTQVTSRVAVNVTSSPGDPSPSGGVNTLSQGDSTSHTHCHSYLVGLNPAM